MTEKLTLWAIYKIYDDVNFGSSSILGHYAKHEPSLVKSSAVEANSVQILLAKNGSTHF